MKLHKVYELPEEQLTPRFARRFFTGEKITVAFLTMKKDCIVPLHQHDSEQFSFIASGALHFVIGGEEVTVRAGQMVEIPSNVPHSAVALEDTTGIDVFSPIRRDWVDGSDHYLRNAPNEQ
jgi:quercetin dioxygenase-like cupin family protein